MVRGRASTITTPQTFQTNNGCMFSTDFDPETRMHSVVCDICGQRVQLTRFANTASFLKHRQGKVCRGHAAKRAKVLTGASGFASSSQITLDDFVQAVQISSRHNTPSTNSRATSHLPSRSPSCSPSPVRDRSRSRKSTPATPRDKSPAPAPIPEPTVPESFRVLLCRDTTVAIAGSLPCPGMMVFWEAGSIWETYPYSLHGQPDSPGWVPIELGSDDRSLRLRSDNCAFPKSGSNGMPCNACRNIQSNHRFQNFLERARSAKDNTSWTYLSAHQRKAAMAKMQTTIRRLRTELSNARRRISNTNNKMNDYQRIMMMLSTNDFPSPRRLLAVSLRRGASASAILRQLQLALDGLYTPRGGFTERDLDIAFISKALGGRRLLYALQKSKGLPSDRTLRRNRPIPKLLASIGTPSSDEIGQNIAAFLSPDVTPPPSPSTPGGPLPGHILMFDGVALEGCCRYCPKRDSILGLCREHFHDVSVKCDDIDGIEKIRTLLEESDESDERKLCYGNDATVVAIAPYGRDDHYTPTPIIVSPSDKTEKGEAMAKWIQTVLKTWKEHQSGEGLHGPVWALGSDGDSSFRVAKHILCMKVEIDLGIEWKGTRATTTLK